MTLSRPGGDPPAPRAAPPAEPPGVPAGTSLAGVTRPPSDITGLLRALLGEDPGRPRLTWYGPGGERVELSAKVLDNWVAKTANLLVEEVDAGPGTRVELDLPAHWRSVVWLLAVWSTGACAVPAGAGAAAVVTVDPAAHRARHGSDPGALVVAVALPALATAFGPGLPPGAIDAATAVRSYGDVFVPPVRPSAGDPALAGHWRPGPLAHADLLATATREAEAAGYPPRVRLLTSAGPAAAVRDWLGPLTLSGSLVLHHDLAGLDPAERQRLVAQEAVTAEAVTAAAG